MKTSSGIIRNLELRVARLERQAGSIDDHALEQYSRSQQLRDERAESRRRKIKGPSSEEMLYNVMAAEYKMNIDMLSSGGNASIKIPINSFALRDADNLIAYLNLKANGHVFGISRDKITITSKHEKKFTLAFDYKLDQDSESVVIYSGRSLY